MKTKGPFARDNSSTVAVRLTQDQVTAVRTLASSAGASVGEVIRHALVRLAEAQGPGEPVANDKLAGVLDALGLPKDAPQADILAALEDLIDQLRGTPILPEHDGPVLDGPGIAILSSILGCPAHEAEAFARSFRCAADRHRRADATVKKLVAPLDGRLIKLSDGRQVLVSKVEQIGAKARGMTLEEFAERKADMNRRAGK